MNIPAVNEHLAHLMQVQGGLLDAYLEQNLGGRYAYAIVVWETHAPRRVRAVTNVTHYADTQALVRDFGTLPEMADTLPIEVERAPRLLGADAWPREGS